jgi:hypothetical protein
MKFRLDDVRSASWCALCFGCFGGVTLSSALQLAPLEIAIATGVLVFPAFLGASRLVRTHRPGRLQATKGEPHRS